MSNLMLKSQRRFQKATATFRMLPHFIIFGVARCGTTSLYNYLTQHPKVAAATAKEVSFFDYHFHQGRSWYTQHFPLRIHHYYDKQLVTGEATPSYMHHPLVPGRIKEWLPTVKLILLLRNPVDRAYSHYCQIVNTGRETLPFDIAVRLQLAERDFFMQEQVLTNEKYFRRVYYPDAYISKSVYIENIKRWFNTFPQAQILVVKNEELATQPEIVFQTVLQFLELPTWHLKEYKTYNYHGAHFSKGGQSTTTTAKYETMTVAMREQLVEYFKPFNQQLYEFLGRDLGWDK